MPFSLWWVGLALSLMGFVLLAVTTVFELSIIPQRIRPYAFWAALLLFMMGVSLSVIFT
ncbi:MAG TPA: hypothetical protein VGK99_20725 [Acidobacteriota bacterium]|jgi:hypothetical protein